LSRKSPALALLVALTACTTFAIAACGGSSQSGAGPNPSAIQPIKVRPGQEQRFAALLDPLSRSGMSPSNGQLAAPDGDSPLAEACGGLGADVSDALAVSDLGESGLELVNLERCLKALIEQLALLSATGATAAIPISEPASGSITTGPGGLVTYTAAPEFPGEDQFELIVTGDDGHAVRLRMRVAIGDPEGSK
jgi:hypothetical protein